jgi:outer membrane protein assembly factor BamB
MAFLFLLPLSLGCHGRKTTTDPDSSSKPLEWQWSCNKATLKYSIEKHLMDFEVERVEPKGYYSPIHIRSRQDRSIIYSFTEASEATVFTRWKYILYVAEYSPIATGCEVVAVNLKTGEQHWRTKLQGIGPTGHSKYQNRVNIETDGKVIVVTGNEANGKYIEHIDAQNGKTLSNKQIDVDVSKK